MRVNRYRVLYWRMPPRTSSFTPGNVLGSVLAKRRGKLTQAQAAQAAGLKQRSWSYVERGAHMPSPATARALAAWLGWSLEDVFKAAETPAE